MSELTISVRCTNCDKSATFWCSFGKTRMGPVSVCSECLPDLVRRVTDSLLRWKGTFKAEPITHDIVVGL